MSWLCIAGLRKVSDDKAFLLSVKMKFKTKQDKETFKSLFKPMTEFVRLHEPKTLSYLLYESDQDETQVVSSLIVTLCVYPFDYKYYDKTNFGLRIVP